MDIRKKILDKMESKISQGQFAVLKSILNEFVITDKISNAFNCKHNTSRILLETVHLSESELFRVFGGKINSARSQKAFETFKFLISESFVFCSDQINIKKRNKECLNEKTINKKIFKVNCVYEPLLSKLKYYEIKINPELFGYI